MTDTTDATVRTLSAEVHVLKVGNRQITQSVAKQLDFTDPSELEPFGRIHFNSDELGFDIRLIGRHKDTGALVTAIHRRPGAHPLIQLPGDGPAPVLVVSESSRMTRDTIFATFDGRMVEHFRDEVEIRVAGSDLHVDDETGEKIIEDREPGLYPGDNSDEIKQALIDGIAAHDQNVAEFEQSKALPLIVLAGLR